MIDLADEIVLAGRLDDFFGIDADGARLRAIGQREQVHVWADGGRNVGAVAGRSARHEGGAGEPAILVQALVAGEEERPFTGERPTEVTAVLIPVQRRLVHIGWIEVVP